MSLARAGSERHETEAGRAAQRLVTSDPGRRSSVVGHRGMGMRVDS